MPRDSKRRRGRHPKRDSDQPERRPTRPNPAVVEDPTLTERLEEGRHEGDKQPNDPRRS